MPLSLLLSKGTDWSQCAAVDKAKSACNLHSRNFAKRLRAYVIDKYVVSRVAAKDILDGAFTETFESIPVCVADPIVMELRECIPRTSSGKIRWSPHDPMLLYYEFLQQFAAGNEENANDPTYKPKRTLSVLPTKQGFKASYCKVDSTELRSLLLRSPDVDRSPAVDYDGRQWMLGESLVAINRTTWNAMSELWWRRLLNVEEIEKQTSERFHHEITTDGYGASVVMSRPRQKPRGEKWQRRKQRRRRISTSTDGASENKDSDMSLAHGIPLRKVPA